MNHDPQPPPTIPALLRELRDETTTLFRQEVALAKTELKENVRTMGSHVAQLAVGAFVAYAGIIVLLIGIGHLFGALLVRFGVDPGVATWLAPIAVGLIAALVGWMLLARARTALGQDDLTPRQTIDTLRASKQWAQDKLHPSS